MKLSNERMREIIDECDKLELVLANDPTVLGPKYLQDMIAQCRNFTNMAVNLLSEVRRSKMALDMDLRRKKALFKIQADEYLSKNLTVRSLPNIKDREAQINLILKDDHREIVNLENDLLDLDHVEDMVKLRHRELKDTMREIQTQRGLIRDEYETGSMYGDERPTAEDQAGAYTPAAQRQKMDPAEFDRLIEGGIPEEEPKEQSPAPAVESTPEPTPVVKAEEAPKVEATPNNDVQVPKSEEDEILAFFENSGEAEAPIPPTESNEFDDLIANL